MKTTNLTAATLAAQTLTNDLRAIQEDALASGTQVEFFAVHQMLNEFYAWKNHFRELALALEEDASKTKPEPTTV